MVRIEARPKAGRSRWLGLAPGGAAFRVALAAAPERGKANAELVSFLAALWGIAKSRLRIVRGRASRSKTVLIEGDPKALARLVGAIGAENG